MNHDTSLSSPRALPRTPGAELRVVTGAQLRRRGLTAAQVSGRCTPRGPWQQLLPGVYLLHPGPAGGRERLRAALLYAGRPAGGRRGGENTSGAAEGTSADAGAVVAEGAVVTEGAVVAEGAVVTGVAALALHGFAAAPPVPALARIDVLVPRTRRLRAVGFVRVVRAALPPTPLVVDGFPVVTAERAVADVVAGLDSPAAVRLLLAEAARDGHCEPASLVAELSAAKLLGRPAVTRAVEQLLAEGRSLAEGRLYAMVRAYGLPEPLWNVDLRLPGGPHLGSVDAYWPEEAVAVELDTARAPRYAAAAPSTPWPAPRGSRGRAERGPGPAARAVRREHLERLGVTVVRLPAEGLREAAERQAGVVRTALCAARDREPAAYVVALPR
ncbi:hypothetical protein [Streptomyces sp. NBC_00102]|uniref:hypothetical protein n=1 Tax=Streptomyces sp. NBC_00102 TaxID=2975652 RepID=UPI00224E99E6|nr:hypothetical protein [Streptomyces sp. NBC_00102]MCX5397033.1 hypothetical protein [Streptomyces sp. NBC_00102]